MPPSDLLLDAPHPDREPSLLRLAAEALTPVQLLRLARHADRLHDAPRPADGTAPLVVTIPGWFTPDVAMAPMRAYLRVLGHDVTSWGLGHNTSDVLGKVRRFVPELRALAEERGAPIALVGWSLGGLVAREVARDAPDAVDRIVTIAAPAIGGPRWTNARHVYPRAVVEHYQAVAKARDAFPIRRPITAIVTRRDGVIHWRAQVDRTSPEVAHVEVGGTHAGLALDPDVWIATATALATPAVGVTARSTRSAVEAQVA